MVDTRDLKSLANGVPVRVRPPAPIGDQSMFTSEIELDLAEWLDWIEWCQTQPNGSGLWYCSAPAAIATL